MADAGVMWWGGGDRGGHSRSDGVAAGGGGRPQSAPPVASHAARQRHVIPHGPLEPRVSDEPGGVAQVGHVALHHPVGRLVPRQVVVRSEEGRGRQEQRRRACRRGHGQTRRGRQGQTQTNTQTLPETMSDRRHGFENAEQELHNPTSHGAGTA